MVTGLVPQPGVWLLALNIHQTCFEQPGLLEADGVHLSEKAKSTFTHRLAKLENRALNYNCWGRRASVHPISITDSKQCPELQGIQTQGLLQHDGHRVILLPPQPLHRSSGQCSCLFPLQKPMELSSASAPANPNRETGLNSRISRIQCRLQWAMTICWWGNAC